MRMVCVLLCFTGFVWGQDRYLSWRKDWDVCPRVVMDGPVRPGGSYGAGSTGGLVGAGPIGEVSWQFGARFIPRDQRKDASRFAAVEESGKGYPMSTFRGRVVVVGFWSVGCEPSLFLLGEMAQLLGKAKLYGFEVLPVNFDPERWRVIGKFLNQSRMELALKGVKVFTPGLGEQGVNCFMDVIPGLPTYFILDRQGKVAVQATGYKDGDLAHWLKLVLSEPADPLMDASAPAVPQEKGHQ